MMAAHPEAQERVIQELDDIFGDSDRQATFQDTLEMKYLERCLMETLRLYPPVPAIARQINEEVVLGENIGQESENFPIILTIDLMITFTKANPRLAGK